LKKSHQHNTGERLKKRVCCFEKYYHTQHKLLAGKQQEFEGLQTENVAKSPTVQ